MKSLFAVAVVVAAASLVAAQEHNCTCPDEVDVNCPEIEDFAVLFPHPDHCSMFCICEDEGCGSEVSCPPDLLYNEELQTCDYADNVSISGVSVAICEATLQLS